jgi:hypothetical protein
VNRSGSIKVDFSSRSATDHRRTRHAARSANAVFDNPSADSITIRTRRADRRNDDQRNSASSQQLPAHVRPRVVAADEQASDRLAVPLGIATLDTSPSNHTPRKDRRQVLEVTPK